MQIIEADSEQAVVDVLREGQPLEIIGCGSKLGLGRPVQVDRRLSLANWRGVTLYEPEELILSVKAGTLLSEIEPLLAGQGQTLAFEPPDLSGLLASPSAEQTIGGIVASALAGPRRCVAGGVRDHVLGLRAVNGRGELFRAGGRVVKNVTGYDLCKLLTGSFGTMAVFTELTLKLLPAAETEATVMLPGLDAAAAVAVMCLAMGSSAGISGAAWLPAETGSVTCLRLEGFAASVAARQQRLTGLLAGHAALSVWPESDSRAWWRALRDALPLADDAAAGRAIWKISLAATQAPALLRRLAGMGVTRAFLDWGGALLWLALPCGDDGQAPALRALLPPGAHAMLLVAPAEVRRRQPVFQPLPAAQATVEDRVRRSFDPDRLLNPGRMSPPIAGAA